MCQLKLSASTVVSAARAAIGMILTQVVTCSRSQKLSDADSTCVRAEGSPSHVIFLTSSRCQTSSESNVQNLPVEDEVSIPASASHRLLRP